MLITSTESPATAASHDVDTLVRAHLPLVGYLVNELLARLPGHIRRDDLTSAGLAALAQAASAYDPGREVPFNKYATMRIRGALLDELRANDWAGRTLRSKVRERDTAATELEAALGRPATREELAAYLGVNPTQLHTVDNELHRSVVLSLHGFGDLDVLDSALPVAGETPEETLIRREQVGYLHGAVDALPERLRVIVEGYYFDGRSTAELAEELQLGESRVSQLRIEALRLLKDGLNSQLDPEQLPEEARPGGCVARRRAAYFSAVATSSDFRSRLQPLAEEAEPAAVQTMSLPGQRRHTA